MARPNTNYEPQKEKLIKVAFDLFLEKGYEDTTIKQIMQKAGLTKAGMYHYFASKEEILDAAISYGIEKDIDFFRKSIALLKVEDKMLHIIEGSASPNELMQKMAQIKDENQNSYASYRIREHLIHAYIPIMEEVLREGIAAKVYHVDYPAAAAEFIVLLAKSLVEPNILPALESSKAEERMYAFLQFVESWLRPTPKHMEDITAKFRDVLAKREIISRQDR